MKAEILKRLLEAHADGDGQAFRKAALQLAATEGNAGHTRIAEELRAIVARLPVATGVAMGAPSVHGAAAEPFRGATSTAVRGAVGLGGGAAGGATTVDIAQPRGDLAGLLTGGFRPERLPDIVAPEALCAQLTRVLREYRHRTAFESWGVSPSRKLLFHGPPGCGKTLAASVVAGELGLPLMTVRFDGLFSRFLGATAGHLKVIFDEMPRRPAVYLFDEFDAVAKSRGDAQEVGEVRRVVTSFLQLIDADQSASVLIAATNFDALLDRAVFRRFDVIVPFALPTAGQLDRLIQLRLRAFALSPKLTRRVAAASVGLSYADASRACDDAIKAMVLDGRQLLEGLDLERSFHVARARGVAGDPLPPVRARRAHAPNGRSPEVPVASTKVAVGNVPDAGLLTGSTRRESGRTSGRRGAGRPASGATSARTAPSRGGLRNGPDAPGPDMSAPD